MFRNWNRWSTIYFILSMLMVVISFFCICNASLVGEGYEKVASLPEITTYIAFGIANILACTLFIMGAIKSKYVPNMVLLCILVILFTFNLVFTFNTGKSIYLDSPKFGPKEYELPNQSLIFIFQFFLILLNFFFIIDFLPKVSDGKTITNLVCLFLITLVAVLLIISYATELDKYKNIIKGLPEPSITLFKTNAIQSIIFNPNPFSFLLFVAMVSCSILHFRTGKIWFVFPMIGFLLHIPFTFCRVSIVISLVYFVAYFIIRCVITFKKHPTLNKVMLCICSGFLLAFVIGFATLETSYGWVSKFLEAFNASIESLSGRITLWEGALDLFKNNYFLGYGYKVFDYVLERYIAGGPTETNGYTVHNGYLDFIGTGGVIFALVGLIFYVVLFVRCIRILKYDCSSGLLGLLLIVCGLGFSVFETGRICFAYNIDYASYSMLIWMPISSIYFKEVKLTKFEKIALA